MPSKTDLNAANLPQLYDAHKLLDQCMVNAEGKDATTKNTWPFSSLWSLNRFVIPTKDNMSLTPTGLPKISDWRTSDFLYTAESAERDFGYPVGLLSREQHYCQYRDGVFPVFTDIYGYKIDIDEPELDYIIQQARNFPEKLFKEYNRVLHNTYLQNFSNVLDIDMDEPFGIMIAYQQTVISRICKEAKQAFPAIDAELSKLAARQLRSRLDANTLRDGAETYLSLREIATSGRKFSWDRMFQETVLRHLADDLANSSSPGVYRLTKAVNELQDALSSGRQVSRRGFFARLTDAFPPLELSLPQDAPQVAMVAAHAPNPRQHRARKDSEPHYPAHNAKAEPDYHKFMKDIKAELGALRTAFGRLEALMNRKRKPDDRKDKQGKVHAGLAQGKNHKAQKGAAVQATRPIPSSYMGSSEEEQSDEEVHFANYARVCDPVPTFTRAESILGPFQRTVVQSAKPKQSLQDYFGLSAQRLSNKKRGKTAMGATTTAGPATLHQTSSVDGIVEIDINARDLAELPDFILEKMGYTVPQERLPPGVGTIDAAPSGSTDEEAPDLVSTSSDEDDEDRHRAFPSLAAAGVKLSTTLHDSVRTRHMARMDSFNYPDAVICSDGDADRTVTVAISKTTEAL